MQFQVGRLTEHHLRIVARRWMAIVAVVAASCGIVASVKGQEVGRSVVGSHDSRNSRASGP